jgi:hypothetical protein
MGMNLSACSTGSPPLKVTPSKYPTSSLSDLMSVLIENIFPPANCHVSGLKQF